MSKQNWKPGDVAITAQNTVALCHNGGQMIDTDGAPWSNDKFPTNLRRLVVLDPESAEDSERLAVALTEALRGVPGGGCMRPGTVQAALREFANPTPPKPEEPVGLGAVVRDAMGRVWVLVYSEPGDVSQWAPQGRVSVGSTWRDYDRLDAVEVLSEGVTP